jgi:hypothetical protein
MNTGLGREILSGGSATKGRLGGPIPAGFLEAANPRLEKIWPTNLVFWEALSIATALARDRTQPDPQRRMKVWSCQSPTRVV